MECTGGTGDLAYTLHPATPDNKYFSVMSVWDPRVPRVTPRLPWQV